MGRGATLSRVVKGGLYCQEMCEASWSLGEEGSGQSGAGFELH